MGRYKFENYDFEKLVEAILEIPGNFRVRISSIEPDGYSESFFRLFKNPKLTPHMHICLQSGSEDILLKMRRMHSAKEFEQIATKLKTDYPQFNLTTDIIVGFPGETVDGATAELQEIIDRLAAQDSTFKATVESTFWRAPFEVDSEAPIVKILDQALGARIGHHPAHTGQTYWTDAALLAGAGIETVLLGPKGCGLHSAEEWVDLESVVDLAYVLAETAINYCG